MKIQLVKKTAQKNITSLIIPIVSLLMALVFNAVVLIIFRIDPLQAYAVMVKGSLGSTYALSETLVKAIPLMLTGLGVAIAFHMHFWNIGAEGQLAMGGIAAAFVPLFMQDIIPLFLILPTMLVFAMAAGAIWGLIPAGLKAALGVNEILTTLMMNYIAILAVEFLYLGPWRDPEGYGFPGTAKFSQSAWLPTITGRIHYGLLFALVGAIILWVILKYTKLGYEIRLIGENPKTARYSGINIGKNIVIVMLLSGGLAGIAGMSEVAGISHRLYTGLTVGYGYTAIIVAWLANLNPWGVLVVSFLMGALLIGGDQLQVAMQTPAAVAEILQGAILFFMLGGSIFNRYKLQIILKKSRAKDEVKNG